MADDKLEFARDIAALKAHYADIKDRLKETEEECRERESKIISEMRDGFKEAARRMDAIEKWKVNADIRAAVWAAKLSGASAIFGGVALYWEQIKSFFGAGKP